MASASHSVGVLGGSFDPVHNGHVAIARSFLDSGKISELWVLLTPDPPHKNNQALSNYQQRFEMLQAAFQSMDDVNVSDFEKQLPQPSYTVQTLQQLTQRHPERTFYLCMGGDSMKEFKQWKDWQEILSYCELLVAQRPGEEVEPDPELAAHTHFVTHQPVDISSTTIREAVARGEDISAYVPEEVCDLIYQYNLYKNQ